MLVAVVSQGNEHVDVPDGLIQAINQGDCVAFLGAGFTAAARLPAWGTLLEQIAAHAPPAIAEYVAQKVSKGSAHAYDEAAQILQDELGAAPFVHALRASLGQPRDTPVMRERMHMLRGIPFRGILTLNYDAVVPGRVTSPEAYRSFLRPKHHRWWEDRFWGESRTGAPVLKLHGDLEQPDTVVLTRRDYRRRLYERPAYMTFLRSVLAQQTVLYLGFSFADAYLNELRSEILSLVGQGTTDIPLAYAIVNDVPEQTWGHYRRNEGVYLMTYDTSADPTHRGFDEILSAIHQRTDPVLRFARMTRDKRLLWVDDTPANKFAVYAFLQRAARLAGTSGYPIDEARTAVEALARLGDATTNHAYDLIITHWGHGRARDADGQRISTAERLLRDMRARDIRCPVLIFSTARGANQRKRIALGLGAQGYFYTYGGLLRGIERVFADDLESV